MIHSSNKLEIYFTRSLERIQDVGENNANGSFIWKLMMTFMLFWFGIVLILF